MLVVDQALNKCKLIVIILNLLKQGYQSLVFNPTNLFENVLFSGTFPIFIH